MAKKKVGTYIAIGLSAASLLVGGLFVAKTIKDNQNTNNNPPIVEVQPAEQQNQKQENNLTQEEIERIEKENFVKQEKQAIESIENKVIEKSLSDGCDSCKVVMMDIQGAHLLVYCQSFFDPFDNYTKFTFDLENIPTCYQDIAKELETMSNKDIKNYSVSVSHTDATGTLLNAPNLSGTLQNYKEQGYSIKVLAQSSEYLHIDNGHFTNIMGLAECEKDGQKIYVDFNYRVDYEKNADISTSTYIDYINTGKAILTDNSMGELSVYANQFVQQSSNELAPTM